MARYDDIHEIQPNLDGKGLRIGIAMSRFNLDVCEGLLSAAVAALAKAGVAEKDIVLATAPGALELPLILRKMAESGKFDALVALGAVIRGDTYHFEVVSNEMASGITRATLDTGVPIANGVLTTNTDHQATSRMTEKGRDAALCAIEMAHLLKAL
jgi:6,7-dimethyl-8-ribityllumazine synthase